MSARTLMQWCLVGMPGFLMAFLSLGARTYRDGFEFRSYNRTQNETIEAYAQPLRGVDSLPKTMPTPSDFPRIRRVAEVWINGLHSGALRPIPPSHADEEIPRGAREQILVGRSSLVSMLKSASHVASKAGRKEEAIRFLLQAYEVLEVSKTSDAFLMGLSARSQWTTVAHLSRELKGWKAEDRRRWVAELRRLLAITSESSRKAKEMEIGLKQGTPETVRMVGGMEIRDLKTLLAYRSRNLALLTSKGRTGTILESQGVIAVQAQREQEAALRLVLDSVQGLRPLPTLMAEQALPAKETTRRGQSVRPSDRVPPWSYPAWKSRVRWFAPNGRPMGWSGEPRHRPVTGSTAPRPVASLRPMPSP
ncbi:MAG: hypothetical protein N2109_00250 [Fimbriimonadales bacterium]|nr:hypothetical protein [Fimbriimonadales bacterium]